MSQPRDLRGGIPRVPKLVSDDPLPGKVCAPPLARRLSPVDSPAGFLRSGFLPLSPDHDAAVAFVVQNVVDRGWTPVPRDSSLLRLRGLNAFVIEIDGDALQRFPSRVPLKNSSHRHGFRREAINGPNYEPNAALHQELGIPLVVQRQNQT